RQLFATSMEVREKPMAPLERRPNASHHHRRSGPRAESPPTHSVTPSEAPLRGSGVLPATLRRGGLHREVRCPENVTVPAPLVTRRLRLVEDPKVEVVLSNNLLERSRK